MKSAVTLIFFNRPNTLSLVFEKVRLAKPPKLFLIQDGAREGNAKDIENIAKCREVVKNIDWECEVYENYSNVNLGCGMRPQTGITWVLSQVESTIILEDDCVPDMTFFEYCDELLEKYKDDERVCYISGLNHFEEWDFGNNSYGFAKYGAIWGWATWRRAWNNYDYNVDLIQDAYVEKIISGNLNKDSKRVDLWKKTNDLVTKGNKISYWDVQWGMVKHSQNQLVIIPKYNLICNIGVGVDSTHSKSSNSMHRKYRDFNNMPTKALEFPLIHPSYMICDTEYDDLLIKCNHRAKNRSLINAILNKVNIFKKG